MSESAGEKDNQVEIQEVHEKETSFVRSIVFGGDEGDQRSSVLAAEKEEVNSDDSYVDLSGLQAGLTAQGAAISLDELVLVHAKDLQSQSPLLAGQNNIKTEKAKNNTIMAPLPTLRGGNRNKSSVSLLAPSSSSTSNISKCENIKEHKEQSKAQSSSSRELLQMTSLADRLASMHFALFHILTNGKMMAIFLAGSYLSFVIVMWFPLYLWSRLLTNTGVYITILLCVYTVGQYVVRWLIFPGSTYKIQQDISAEFAKYSLRVLDNAVQVGLELSNHIQKIPPNAVNSNTAQLAWKRMGQYRNRIFVVYCNALQAVYGNGESAGRSSTLSEPLRTASSLCGNNPFRGDLQPFPFSTSLADAHRLRSLSSAPSLTAHAMLSDLRFIIHILEQMDHLYFKKDHRIHSQSSTSDASTNKSLHGLSSDLSKHCVSFRATLRSIRMASSASEPNDDEEGDRRGDALLARASNNNGDSASIAASTKSKLRQGLQKASEVLRLVLDPFFEQSQAVISNEASPGDIFNMHVLRGTLLSRYIGARQFWVPNSYTGGFVDCIVIPPLVTATSMDASLTNKAGAPKAVLYCNPNAGLYEVATGMNLMSGNVGTGASKSSSKDDSENDPSTNWTDFYLRQGYHVVLFNYSGYGRSHGRAGPRQLMPTMYSHQNTARPNEELRRRSRTNLFYQPVEGGIASSVSNDLHDYEGHEKYDMSPRAVPKTCFENWIERKTGRRILFWFTCGFKPTPQSLKSDGLCVSNFINDALQIPQIVIHGESIGGMAAASTARELTNMNRPLHDEDDSSPSQPPRVSLLVCDRTFCNLEATAQRLVGEWSGYAIRFLTRWNTDVAGDFQASKCPKVVATDAADMIIADASSLKSGLAISQELFGGQNTHFLGWVTETPWFYRMADWEGVSVTEAHFSLKAHNSNAPSVAVWPADKHVSMNEAIHFGSCVRRIGKVASYATRRKDDIDGLSLNVEDEEGGGMGDSFLGQMGSRLPEENDNDDDESIDLQTTKDFSLKVKLSDSQSCQKAALMEAWRILSLCDGFCGLPLGVAAKNGTDCAVSWLCAALVYGCQVVAASAEARCNEINMHLRGSSHVKFEVVDEDFGRHLAPIIAQSVRKGMEAPRALHAVTASLKKHMQSLPNALSSIKYELQYCICMLNYVQLRISSGHVAKESLDNSHCRPIDQSFGKDTFSGPGSFFRLHCGHNNHFSTSEKVYLTSVLKKGN